MFYRVEIPTRSFQWLNDMEYYEIYSAGTKRRKIKAPVDNLFFKFRARWEIIIINNLRKKQKKLFRGDPDKI